MHCSPNEVESRIPDPLEIEEMASFLALKAEDRRREDEDREWKRKNAAAVRRTTGRRPRTLGGDE